MRMLIRKNKEIGQEDDGKRKRKLFLEKVLIIKNIK